VPFLRYRPLVSLQDRVDDWKAWPERRPLRSPGLHIPGRRQVTPHFGNRVPAQAESPCPLAPARPFEENKPSSNCVCLHCKHPRPPFRINARKRSVPKVGGLLRRHAAAKPQKPNAVTPFTPLFLRKGFLHCEIEFQYVNPRLAEDPKAAGRGVLFNQSRNLSRLHGAGFGHAL